MVQAQLVSAVRSAISTSSGPLLLEAGLELATKVNFYISILKPHFHQFTIVRCKFFNNSV